MEAFDSTVPHFLRLASLEVDKPEQAVGALEPLTLHTGTSAGSFPVPLSTATAKHSDGRLVVACGRAGMPSPTLLLVSAPGHSHCCCLAGCALRVWAAPCPKVEAAPLTRCAAAHSKATLPSVLSSILKHNALGRPTALALPGPPARHHQGGPSQFSAEECSHVRPAPAQCHCPQADTVATDACRTRASQAETSM